MNRFRDLRRREEDVRLLRIGLGPAPEVGELREDETAMLVHGVGERTVCGDDGVVVVGDLLPRGGRRRGVNARGAAENRQRAAAARLGLVVAPKPLVGRPPSAMARRGPRSRSDS